MGDWINCISDLGLIDKVWVDCENSYLGSTRVGISDIHLTHMEERCNLIDGERGKPRTGENLDLDGFTDYHGLKCMCISAHYAYLFPLVPRGVMFSCVSTIFSICFFLFMGI